MPTPPAQHSRRRSVAVDIAEPGRAALAGSLRSATYEVLPFKSTETTVLVHVPDEVALTITTTEAKGLEPTIDLAVRLRGHGYNVAPHLAARLVDGQGHLADVLGRLREADVDGAFVIGGDAAEPAGEFSDAGELLAAMDEIGHPFSRIGIGGYPEGHSKISDSLIHTALEAKAPYATEILTQLCFDADTTIQWARDVQAAGVELPIRVGVPGAINRKKLIRVSAGLGLGQSARFLKKQSNMFWRFFLPGGYSPDKLVHGVSAAFGGAESNLSGLHVFTFNELESTEAWRQAWISRLA